MAYQSPYASKWSGQRFAPGPQDPAGRHGAESGSSLLRMLGSLAPIAGGTIGAIAGGPVGMGIGAGIGSGVQAVSNYGSDQMMKPYDDAEMKRLARQQQIQSILEQLRGTAR